MSVVEDRWNELHAAYADPATRTVSNLRYTYAATIGALIEVRQRADEVFSVPEMFLGGPEVREAWEKDLQGVLIRSQAIYDLELVPPGVELDDFSNWGQLDPAAPAPHSYEGLIVGRSITNPDELGAGPVPDGAMPDYLAQQLAIISTHLQDMGPILDWHAWMDNVISNVQAAASAAKEAVEGAAKRGLGTLLTVGLIGGIGYLIIQNQSTKK